MAQPTVRKVAGMAEQNAPARAVIDALRQAVETTTARTVFGEPVTRDEVTIIPVTRVRGCGGGGGGGAPAPADRNAEGSGGGLMISAKPVGAFIVKGAQVCWRPCLDLNKLVLGGQIVAVIALLTVRTIIRTKHCHHHKKT